MLIWYPDGWNAFAKWTTKDEIEVAEMVFNKWITIKQAMRQVRSNRDDSKEIELSKINNSFKYSVVVFYTGRGGINQDLLQTVGIAPIMNVGLDIFAQTKDVLHEEKPARILVGHIYDDSNNNTFKIIGKKENQAIWERFEKAFE